LPTVRASAKARLRSLLPGALAVFEECLTSDKDLVRLRTAKYVMSINGIRPSTLNSTESRGERAALPPARGPGGSPSTDDEIEDLLAKLVADGEAS
jgi:hypothetical protein